MTSLTDKQLARIRLRFLDLLKSFFSEAPDAETLSRWRGTFTALKEQQINPDLDRSIARLAGMLTEKKPDEIREEFYQLFINPFGKGIIEVSLSAYVDGHNYGTTLASLRELLRKTGVARIEKYTESEDNIVMMLDLLATLIENENHLEGSRPGQDKMLNCYLVPLGDFLHQSLRNDERADFYETCGAFLKGYLNLEMELT